MKKSGPVVPAGPEEGIVVLSHQLDYQPEMRCPIMARSFAGILAFSLLLSLVCARQAEASCNIYKNGKKVAILDGMTFMRGNTELGTFNGIYVKKKGKVAGRYDGNNIIKNGVTVGYVDGYQVKRADGSVLCVISANGKVKKNGKLYLEFSGYSGIFDIRYLIAVYIFFFDM